MPRVQGDERMADCGAVPQVAAAWPARPGPGVNVDEDPAEEP